MPRLMREQGKSHCLLGFRRKAELIREMQSHPQGCDFIAQHGHQRRILRASARDDHLVTTAPRPESRHHEALHCVRNRSRRQRRRRRHHVALIGAAAELEKSAHVFPAKFLAARRPRRLLPEKMARATTARSRHPVRVPRPRLCHRDHSVVRIALPSPHQSPCCRGRCQKQPPGAATRPQESPSDSQFRQCFARCGLPADRYKEGSRGTAPAARLSLRPRYPRDENRKPPARPAAPRSPRLRPFAKSPPIVAREIVLAVPW